MLSMFKKKPKKENKGIIVGAILAAGPSGYDTSKIFGIIGVVLASINIFGGFIVTYRMLSMFKKKPKKENKG